MPKVKWNVDDDSVKSLADALDATFGGNSRDPSPAGPAEESVVLEQENEEYLLIDDYENVKITSVVACPATYPRSILRLLVEQMNIQLILHNGLDFPQVLANWLLYAHISPLNRAAIRPDKMLVFV